MKLRAGLVTQLKVALPVVLEVFCTVVGCELNTPWKAAFSVNRSPS